MKTKRVCSFLLLFSVLLAALGSCGPASMMRESLDPLGYPDELQAEHTTMTSNLGDIRVMSFNVLSTMSSNETLKQNRYQAVLQEIQGYAPTLLGLQEDAWHWHEFLREHLVTNGSYKRINTSVAGAVEYCSIYYDASVLGTPIASGAYYLTHTGKSGANALHWEDVPQRHRDALAMTQESHMRSNHAISCYIDGQLYTEYDSVLDVRLMSYGIFELNGQRFLYVNTHLQHRSQNGKLATNIPEFLELREMERKAEWDILHKNVTNLLATYGDMPVVITGDLNEVPGSASYNHYEIHYDNASKQARLRKSQDGSWNAAWNSNQNGVMLSGIALKDHTSSSTLDYCFLSPDDFTVNQFQVGEGRQYVTNSAGESGYVYSSDHLPIIVDLSLGKDKDAPPVALQRPGLATSAVSYYDSSKGADTSWYDPSKPDGEYTLTTANQLAGFLALRQNQSCKMKIKLGANMDLGALDPAWQASDSYLFEGTFDGCGHYISFAANGARSLFGALGNATVKNLSVASSSLEVISSDDQSGYGSIASVIAENKTARFYNVYSDCKVSHVGTAEQVGGMVGLVASGAEVEFRYCTYSGEMALAGCNAVGGLVGELGTGVTAGFYNCANAGDVVGNKYTGGLIGISKASALYVCNSANVGELAAGRCSGGLIGTVQSCDDLVINDCAIAAKLDFSSIGEEGSEKSPISVPAGCQIGGLIGRTYDVSGHISGISISGTMKGASNVKTELDSGADKINANYLAAGAIVGFQSIYSEDESVMTGARAYSYLHYDAILVSMEMTEVDSYLGGSRDSPIQGVNGLAEYSLFSYNRIVYDKEKFADSGAKLWGARTDADLRLDADAHSQLSDPYGFSTATAYGVDGWEIQIGISGNRINYYSWKAVFTTWQRVNGGVLVPTAALRDLIQSTMQSKALCTVGYQTVANETDPQKTDIRFVAVMKEITEPSVGFHLAFSYLNEEGARVMLQTNFYCKTVYPSIKGGGQVYTAEQFDGKYFFTVEIVGVPVAELKELMVTVQPLAAKVDGENLLVDEYPAKTYILN